VALACSPGRGNRDGVEGSRPGGSSMQSKADIRLLPVDVGEVPTPTL